MLNRFKRKPANSGQVAVCSTDNMLAIAMVKQRHDQLPLLEICEVYSDVDQEKKIEFLKRILHENNLKNHPCVSLMASDNYDLFMVEAPDVPEDELREAIRWQVKDMIDYPVGDAVIDVLNIPDQKNSGDMVYVVVAKSQDVKEQVDLIKEAGYQLKAIDILELSLRNVAGLIPADENGVALVRLGHERGSITLSKQNVLYFTRHLSDTAPLFGKFYAEILTAEMEGWLDTVVIEIQRSLDYYESYYQQSPVSNIVLVPFERPIDGLNEYLSSQLGINVSYLNVNKSFEVSEPLDYEKMSHCIPAIGAALRAEEAIV